MRVLLDTCTFLWIAADSPELSERCRAVFRDPDDEILLSVASTWEIAIKHQLGKLPLPVPPQEFVPEQRRAHRIDSLSLDEAAALHLPLLPPLHRDPFDRVLACQAIADGLVILTPDPLIRQYPIRTEW